MPWKNTCDRCAKNPIPQMVSGGGVLWTQRLKFWELEFAGKNSGKFAGRATKLYFSDVGLRMDRIISQRNIRQDFIDFDQETIPHDVEGIVKSSEGNGSPKSASWGDASDCN
jgi:hypothetical protein